MAEYDDCLFRRFIAVSIRRRRPASYAAKRVPLFIAADSTLGVIHLLARIATSSSMTMRFRKCEFAR